MFIILHLENIMSRNSKTQNFHIQNYNTFIVQWDLASKFLTLQHVKQLEPVLGKEQKYFFYNPLLFYGKYVRF